MKNFWTPDQVRAFEGFQPMWGTGPNRFWGSRTPPKGRQAVRAQVSTADDGEGTATIRLYDPIDSWGEDWGVSAKEFADALDALDSSVKSINLHVNSPGGEVWEGIAILNQLRQHPATVTATVDGLAASAASFIAVGVDRTVMAANSQMMIHDALGICLGQAADMHAFGDLLDKVSNNIAAVYQSKAGGTLDSWRAAMLGETWYDADEAVAIGLADRLDGPSDAPTDAFDLSQFKHAGREEAPAPEAAARDEHAARARYLKLRATA